MNSLWTAQDFLTHISLCWSLE